MKTDPPDSLADVFLACVLALALTAAALDWFDVLFF